MKKRFILLQCKRALCTATCAAFVFFVLFVYIQPLYATNLENKDVYVQIHTWYNTPWGTHRDQTHPYDQWGAWGTEDFSPEEIFPGSRYRKIASLLYPQEYSLNTSSVHTPITSFSVSQLGSYPLIGLYDSTNEEVIAWQINIAKQAGIDAFAVSVYDIYTDDRVVNGQNLCWMSEIPYQIDSLDRFKQFISIAKQNDFKVFAEVWVPAYISAPADSCGSREGYVQMIAKIIQETAGESSYLKKNGQPVVAVAFYPTTDLVTDILAVQQRTQQDIFWIARDISFLEDPSHVIDMVRTGGLPEVAMYLKQPNYQRQYDTVQMYKNQGWLTATTIYPSFDDAFRLHLTAFINMQYRPQGLALFDSTGALTFQRQLDNTGNADAIWIESWNDYQEQTFLEPNARLLGKENANQQYLLLQTLAQWNNRTLTPPTLPKSYDPLWESATRDADLNNDGVVDILDYNILVGEFGKRNDCANPALVTPNDCDITLEDLNLLLQSDFRL